MKTNLHVVTTALLLTACVSTAFSQTRAISQTNDKGKLIEYKNPFFKTIQEGIGQFETKKKEPKLSFKMDFTGHDLPKSVDEFTRHWHNDPVAQGDSGMCWCYAATSLLESDCYRLHNKEFKFSELYTVYWEYVEKARRYVRQRGDSHFAQGSQGNAVFRIWKKYGGVPANAYTGMKAGQGYYFYHEDYVKLKMMNAIVHKSAVKDLLGKVKGD